MSEEICCYNIIRPTTPILRRQLGQPRRRKLFLHPLLVLHRHLRKQTRKWAEMETKNREQQEESRRMYVERVENLTGETSEDIAAHNTGAEIEREREGREKRADTYKPCVYPNLSSG